MLGAVPCCYLLPLMLSAMFKVVEGILLPLPQRLLKAFRLLGPEVKTPGRRASPLQTTPFFLASFWLASRQQVIQPDCQGSWFMLLKLWERRL